MKWSCILKQPKLSKRPCFLKRREYNFTATQMKTVLQKIEGQNEVCFPRATVIFG